MANNVPPYENAVPKNFFERLGFGLYPAGYDRRVHGPYHPGRYYGPKDNLADIKVKELLQWIGRRDKSPQALAQMMSRGYHRWIDKFATPRKAGIAWPVQFIVLTSVLSYIGLWKTLKHHKNQKYHW